MANSLRTLWNSTAALHARFFSDNPPSFEARWRVFNEEVSEFLLECANANDLTDQEPAKEAADVLVTAIGLLQGLGFEYEDFEAAILATAQKNDSKTLETHAVNKKGKIARIE